MRALRYSVLLVGLAALGCSGKDEASAGAGGSSSGGSSAASAAGTAGEDVSSGASAGGGASTAGGAQSGGAESRGGTSSAGAAGNGAGAGAGGTVNGPGAAGASGHSSLTPDALEASGCVLSHIDAEPVTSILEFVVDISGSMADQTASTLGRTKWEITRAALLEAFAELPDATALGMLLYPNMRVTNQNCLNLSALVPVLPLGAPGSAARTSLTNALAGAVPQSLTPTYDAYQSALEQGLLASQLVGSRSMVLITDGAPTVEPACSVPPGPTIQVDPSPILGLIQEAAEGGVRTFVVGAPGSEESIDGEDARVVWLSKAAELGGTAAPGCSHSGPNFCHVDLTQSPDFAAALEQGLSEIKDSTSSCSFRLPSNPAPDLSRLNVVVKKADGTRRLLENDDRASCSDGWQLGDNVVSLCENSCKEFGAAAGAKIELMVGCATVRAR
jgi:hypothetical protein